MIFPSSSQGMNWLNDGRVMSDVVWYNSNGKSSSHCVYIWMRDGTMRSAKGYEISDHQTLQAASAKDHPDS